MVTSHILAPRPTSTSTGIRGPDFRSSAFRCAVSAVLASSSDYLYIGSFTWLMVKIGVLFSGSNACPLLSHLPTSILSYFYLSYFCPSYSTSLSYPIALFVLRNVCNAILDPSTFICLSKSQSNQISHLTVSPLLNYAKFDNWCD